LELTQALLKARFKPCNAIIITEWKHFLRVVAGWLAGMMKDSSHYIIRVKRNKRKALLYSLFESINMTQNHYLASFSAATTVTNYLYV
jgi:hypothetical protein